MTANLRDRFIDPVATELGDLPMASAAPATPNILHAQSGEIVSNAATALLTVAHRLAATPGAIDATGQNAALNLAYRVVAQPGSIATTGQSSALYRSLRLLGAVTAVPLTAQLANLARSTGDTLTAMHAAIDFTPRTAALKLARKLAVTSGAIVAAPASATLSVSIPANYTLIAASAAIPFAATLIGITTSRHTTPAAPVPNRSTGGANPARRTANHHSARFLDTRDVYDEWQQMVERRMWRPPEPEPVAPSEPVVKPVGGLVDTRPAPPGPSPAQLAAARAAEEAALLARLTDEYSHRLPQLMQEEMLASQYADLLNRL